MNILKKIKKEKTVLILWGEPSGEDVWFSTGSDIIMMDLDENELSTTIPKLIQKHVSEYNLFEDENIIGIYILSYEAVSDKYYSVESGFVYRTSTWNSALHKL